MELEEKKEYEHKIMELELELSLQVQRNRELSEKNQELNNRYQDCYSTLLSVKNLLKTKGISYDIVELNILCEKLRKQVKTKQNIINKYHKEWALHGMTLSS